MRKLNNNEIQKLKKYWKALKTEQDVFYEKVRSMEKQMGKELGIPDLEFFEQEGFCGIGNTSRTIELVHEEELQ